MLLVNLTFVFVSLPGLTNDDGACTAAMAFFHIFLLATLFWFLVEALNMYQVIGNIFISYETNFMAKRCLVAWGEYDMIFKRYQMIYINS